MWPVVPLRPLAHVEDLERRVALAAAPRRSSARRRSIVPDVAVLVAPAGHAAREVAAEVADPDGEPRAARRARVLVVAADQHDLLVAVGDPGEPACRSPACSIVIADRARDVRLVELEVGAHVDEQRALARASARPGAARAACTSTPAVSSGPRLMSTTAWKFGRLGRQLRGRALDEAVLVASPRSSSLWRRS